MITKDPQSLGGITWRAFEGEVMNNTARIDVQAFDNGTIRLKVWNDRGQLTTEQIMQMLNWPPMPQLRNACTGGIIVKYIIEYMKNMNFRLVAEDTDGNKTYGFWTGIGGIACVDVDGQRVYAQADRHIGGPLPCERPFVLVDLGPADIVKDGKKVFQGM